MRVIAGDLRGRRLVAPAGFDTRPTLDRVKEALFSILSDVRDNRVLDCFAGTGSLGIESLSRGASFVTFVEEGRLALAALAKNIDALDLHGRTRVVARPLERVLASPPWSQGSFELVFFDPPYAMIRDGSMQRLLDATAAGLRDSVVPGARVMLEHPAPCEPPRLAEFEQLETRRYGDTALTFYVRP